MRFLFAAGGTGGHLRPALATAAALRRRLPAAPILFLTAGHRAGERFLAGSGFHAEALFPGRTDAPRAADLRAWAKAFARARSLMRDFEPDVVAGFGGYVTAVAALACLGPLPEAALRLALGRGGRSLRRPPLVLFEQNATPGRAVRVFSRTAERVLLAIGDAQDALPAAARPRAIVAGNPLLPEFERNGAAEHRNGSAERARGAAAFGLRPGRPTLLALGGSQGALGVNRLVLEARAALHRRHPDLQILMLTGAAGHAEVAEELARRPEPPTVALAFDERMKEAYEAADVVVARAGGTTLAEVAAVGRPMVLVPYPHGDGHQFANARAFERIGAARVVPEGAGAAERLTTEVARWLDDAGLRARDGERAKSASLPGAAERSATALLEVAERRAAVGR